MIKIEKTQVVGLEPAIRGMRNPMNSFDKSDSENCIWDCVGKCMGCNKAEKYNDWQSLDVPPCDVDSNGFVVGPNDHDLMMRLAKNGSVHAKYRRMIVVYCDITAPLYWWKEFDTYKVGTVANSCSTMHKIQAKEFTLEDFSHEHVFGLNDIPNFRDCIKSEVNDDLTTRTIVKDAPLIISGDEEYIQFFTPEGILTQTIRMINTCRALYLETKDKRYWWQMIQLLPSSYNQKRTVMLNYEVLAGIYPMRKDHKLDEWHEFCDWIKGMPYSELITLEFEEEEKEKPALDSIDDNVHVHLPKNSGRYPWGKKED